MFEYFLHLLPLFHPGPHPFGQYCHIQSVPNQLSLETSSQVHPDLCFTNLLGIFQSTQVDNQDEPSHKGRENWLESSALLINLNFICKVVENPLKDIEVPQ